MKITPRESEKFLVRPFEDVFAVLIYGPERGLVSHRAEQLCRTFVSDLNDPFLVSELSSATLQQYPIQLLDDIQTLPYTGDTGDKKLIRVRSADDTITSAFKILFQNPIDPCGFIVVEGGDLGPRSSLRVVFETTPKVAVALPCYVESGTNLTTTLQNIAQKYSLTLSPEACTYLAWHVEGNRGVAVSEVEKLGIFLAPGTHASLEDVRMTCGDSAEQDFDESILAIADGDVQNLDSSLQRLHIESVAILRLTQKYFQRLHYVVAQNKAGVSVGSAMSTLKPPVFFKYRSRFASQVKRWSLESLNAALKILTQAEARCKRTGMPQREVCSMALFEITNLVGRYQR